MSEDGSGTADSAGSPTQATQPTQLTQATQKPPQSTAAANPRVFASLVPRHPHLRRIDMETSQLLDGGYTIGRFDDCDVVLDRNYISSRHCRLYMEMDADPERPSLYILDTSTNGTFVNDCIIGRDNCTILFNNDRIGFLRAIDALPSDIALEYSIEFAAADNHVKANGEFGAELLRTYDFKHEIGAGNFAKVWMAIHKQTGLVCACKVINKKRHLFSAGLTKIFEREINIMKQLRHANIVPLHELHIDKDRIHIFMEYLEGGDLFTYLSDNGPFAEADCRPLFKQICSAVRYLHANGITHRDIKLDNILIKAVSDGTVSLVKIADFGLARAVGDGETMRTICGTPSYLAPEIVCRDSAGQPYDKSVDVWALGIVLYALHTNSFPFSKVLLNGGATNVSLDTYVSACKMTEENKGYSALTPELQNLLADMLQIDPSQRLTIEAAIQHPWTQTSEDGTPGPLVESAEVWGVLKMTVPDPNDSPLGTDSECVAIDLFRKRTTIGKGRRCDIQISDPQISTEQCEIVFSNLCISVHNKGRCQCIAEGHQIPPDQTRILAHPYAFSLSTAASEPELGEVAAQGTMYQFEIRVFDKPWNVVWVPRNDDLLESGAGRLGPDTGIRTTYKPPPLVLPVQACHLSYMPFRGAKDAYAVGGCLLLDPEEGEIEMALSGPQPRTRAVLSVLDSPQPCLHVLSSSITFGRGPACTVQIDDPRLSQLHCTIRLGKDSAQIENHSANGTFVNAQRIDAPVDLEEGDDIVLLYDRLDMQARGQKLLGQTNIVDSQGHPGKVADAPPEKIEEEHKRMLEKYAESQRILDKYSVMPGKSSDYMAILQRITDENASGARRPKQPLVLKKISDSFTETYLLFKDNLALREEYINYYGEIRLGKVLEDLDRLAGAVAYKHASDGAGDLAPVVFVTASVDRIDLKSRLSPDCNYRLSGTVTYVGFSSMEIYIQLQAVSESGAGVEQDPNLVARFTMVARDKFTGKSSQVNPLLLENESQRRLVKISEQIKEHKKTLAQTNLFKEPPSAEERLVIHQLWLDTKKFQTDTYGSRISLPGDMVWLDQTVMESVTVCFPSDRNVHNKIFGGYLMRLAHELSFANGSVFTKGRPSYVSLDDFSFTKPVNIGSILKLTSQVVYSEPENGTFQVAVSADVIDNLANTMERTNTFYFNFSCPSGAVSRVVPRSYADMMKYLDGRRRAQTGKLISKLQGAMQK
ncbi:hypothetical protein GGF46_002299 [Coemansia sp. RSA 552]|nr:hypothetical protein GGF46_002299 [Coemansia sp. RSA 552]